MMPSRRLCPGRTDALLTRVPPGPGRSPKEARLAMVCPAEVLTG